MASLHVKPFLVAFLLTLIIITVFHPSVKRKACGIRAGCTESTWRPIGRVGLPEPIKSVPENALRLATMPADFAASDGLVLWTMANLSWLDFVLNWVAFVKQAGISNYFVASLDDDLYQELQSRGIHSMQLSSGITGEELDWGSDVFKERGRVKLSFIKTMLEQGLQPFFSDLDVTWLQDPFPLMRGYSAPDMLVSVDVLHTTKFAGELEDCPIKEAAPMGMLNVGIHLMRPAALPLLQEWYVLMNSTSDMEQLAFHKAVSSDIEEVSLREDPSVRLCRSVGGVNLGLLSPAHFANGHLFYTQGVQDWPQNKQLGVIAVHTTFAAGRIEKRHFMREKGLWKADSQIRFKPRGGFLAFNFDIPVDLLLASGPPPNIGGRPLTEEEVRPNMELLKHQLSQLAIAIRLSLALDRELILPPIICGLEFGWIEHNGRVLGAEEYDLPAPCPAAKVLKLSRWVDLAEAGTLPVMHEEAILSNEEMEGKSLLGVEPRHGLSFDASGTLELAIPSMDQQIQRCQQDEEREACSIQITDNLPFTALRKEAFAAFDVLYFYSLPKHWAGDKTLFQQTTKGLLQDWCCSEGNRSFELSF